MKFCYIYTNNANITQNMRFLYINGFILETCHIYIWKGNSKFIKKNCPPEIRPAPPSLIILIIFGRGVVMLILVSSSMWKGCVNVNNSHHNWKKCGLQNSGLHFLLDRLGRYLKLFVYTVNHLFLSRVHISVRPSKFL